MTAAEHARANWRIAAALVVIALFVASKWLEHALEDFLCDETVFSRVVSPNGRLAAVTFEVDCGAVSSFNTQVGIAPAAKPFNHHRYPSVFVVKNTHDLRARWNGDATLVIDAPEDEMVYRRQDSAYGLAIVYD